MSESKTPTPYAVRCRHHNKESDDFSIGELVYMTEDEYQRQLNHPDQLWRCPRCGGAAMWDEETWEKAMGIS